MSATEVQQVRLLVNDDTTTPHFTDGQIATVIARTTASVISCGITGARPATMVGTIAQYKP